MINSQEIKEKYLEYFKARGHAIIPTSSLVPENDPSVLFTTAGMHPLVPFLLGEKHPAGNRLADVQKCIRTGDIDEVGDGWHLTFFEMLGNWSLGDYFKREAIEMSFNFLTKELNIPLAKLAVTCFAGDETVGRDEEAALAWKELGVSDKRIAFLDKEDNWWPAGGKNPGPQGPDTEMFYWASSEPVPEIFDTKDKRWVEIWNDVFMQFNRTEAGVYEELKQKNVDTGMGVERTVAVLNGFENVYEIDCLKPILKTVETLSQTVEIKAQRIITDHLRAAVFILSESVEPSNVERGYVLRRLIRRSIRYGLKLGISGSFTDQVAEVVIKTMGQAYPELKDKKDFILNQLKQEEEKFSKTIEKGIKEFEKLAVADITGHDAFILFSTYGFPWEMTSELAQEKGIKVDQAGFEEEFKKHQDLSRSGSEQKFKGGLADTTDGTARLHTATHLMLSALRKVLGEHVLQKGANITAERIRFDFSHPDKMTAEQLKQVEDLVNEQIDKKLEVVCDEVDLEEAKRQNAMGVFEHKYGDKVKVYTVGDFSKEICGGPHANNTGELGHFKIVKEESSSSGVRRIKAVLN